MIYIYNIYVVRVDFLGDFWYDVSRGNYKLTFGRKL